MQTIEEKLFMLIQRAEMKTGYNISPTLNYEPSCIYFGVIRKMMYLTKMDTAKMVTILLCLKFLSI